MWTEIRHAVRGLWKAPAFSIVAIIVLALAVAVNTAMFSLVNAVFFQTLPVKSPGELTYVYLVDPKMPNLADGIDFESYLALKARADVFADGAQRSGDTARVLIDGVERRLTGEMVTGNYFEMLGVTALIGRPLLPSDDAGDAAPAMAISEGIWRREFRADPGVIGRTVQLVSDGQFLGHYREAGTSYTIVGVVSGPFVGAGSAWTPAGYWVPSAKRVLDFRDPDDDRRWDYYRQRYGRPILRRQPDVSFADARQVVDEVGRERQREKYPRSPTISFLAQESGRVLLPFDPGSKVVPARLAVAVMSVSGLVLLIALANLVGLFTARGVAERGEVAIRLALGASRASLVRYFVAQGMVVAMASGALALLLAYQAIAVLSSTAPTQLSRGASILYVAADFQVPIDWRVWAFAALLPVVAGLVIAASRARQAWRTDVRAAIQVGSQTTVAARRLHLRYVVVIPQIALALAILILAGVFIRALLASEMAAPGYDAAQVSLIDFDMPQPRRSEMKQANENRALIEQKIREYAATIGGVSHVSLTDNMRFGPLRPSNTWVLTEERFVDRSAMKWVGYVGVTPGYMETLGIKLVRGRDFDARDEQVTDVAIVSMRTAEMLWPGQDPLGRHFTKTWPDQVTPPKWVEVIGVVNDVRLPLAESAWNPLIYAPKVSLAGTLVVKGPGRPEDIAREVVAAIKSIEPRARITRTRTLTSAIDEVRYPRRLATAVLVTTGLVGLVLAAIGLYGVVSYSVVQRRREMGVRRALGAARRDIIGLVVREGMTAAVVGSGAGLLLGYWAVRLANRFALPMPPVSWLSVALVPVFLAIVVFLACVIPARRAARADPIVALREL